MSQKEKLHGKVKAGKSVNSRGLGKKEIYNYRQEIREISEIRRERGDWGYGYKRGRVKNKESKKYIPYKRERFLQANHQFSVWPEYFAKTPSCLPSAKSFDGSISSVDENIDWKFVSEVTFKSTKLYECPICLNPPVCPRIFPCGHTLCWPCVLRYVTTRTKSKQKTAAPCPVCQTLTVLQDLRPARLIQVPKVEESQKCKFVLLRRLKTSTLVESLKSVEDDDTNTSITLVNEALGTSSSLGVLHSSSPSAFYNRVTVTLDMNSVLEREELELTSAIKEAFVSSEDSLPSLYDCKDLWMRFREDCKRNSENAPRHFEELINTQKKIVQNDESSQEDGVDEFENNYYFYQIGDGQHMYLHFMCFKYLLMQFENVDQLPKEIEATVLNVDSEMIQEESVRKRYKTLSHLPESCNFQFVLADISPFLSTNLQVKFKEEVKQRETYMREVKALNEQDEHSPTEAIVEQSIIPQNYINTDNDFEEQNEEKRPINQDDFPELGSVKSPQTTQTSWIAFSVIPQRSKKGKKRRKNKK